VRSTCLTAVVLAGVAAGCSSQELAALLPRQIFSLNTWTRVPEGQYDVQAKVGEVLYLPLGPGTDRSQLGWMKVSVNRKPVDPPDFDIGEEASSYIFRAEQPGEYQVEIRREVVRRTDGDEADADGKPKSLTDPVGPDTTFTRSADPKWPPRIWYIKVTE
jgi:hypothetical protein